MPRIIRRLLSFTAFLCLALMYGGTARAERSPFSKIVVFGDSLSDTGNAFAVINDVATPPDYSLDAFLVPSALYARGGHHATNGATWIEQFARPLGLAGSVRPALRSDSPYASNYAIATTRARTVGSANLSVLVSLFLQQTGGTAPSDALYVIELGGHDVRDAVANPASALTILQSAVTAITSNISTLYAAGARTFLVWNVPDIGATPAVRLLDSQFPGTAQQATLLTQLFNANLALALAQLQATLPGIQIVPFDAYGLLTDIVNHPDAYGLTNVTSACVTPDVPPFACQPADDNLFWDGIHPTEEVHAIIAREIALLLQ